MASDIDVIPRDPMCPPMRWTDEVAQRVTANPRKTIAIWLTLRTITSPRTAILLEDLHAMYFQDFNSVQAEDQLLDEDELLKFVTESYENVKGIFDQQGVCALVGLTWTTWKQTERSAKANGVNLDVRHEKRGRKRHRPEEAGNKEWLLQPMANDIDSPEARKDSMYDPATIDPDGKYRAWLREALVEDDTCMVGYGDIWLAFKRKYGDDDTDDFGFDDTQSLTVDQLFRLLCDCFTHLKFKEHRAVYNADHLRWRKLPSSVTHSLSVHGSKIGFPERLRKEAHELLYMKPKARVRNWQRMYFREEKGVTISLHSLWSNYSIAFSRSSETHKIASTAQFLRILQRQYESVQAVEVSEKHVVLLSLGVREGPFQPRDVLALQRLLDFQRLQISEPTGPRNLFNQKLLEDPLLALPNPHRWKKPRRQAGRNAENGQQDNDDQNNNGNQKKRKQPKVDAASASGPFLQRLYRRGEGLLLGEEEPGFPGESMKLQSKRMQRKITAYQDASMKMIDADPANKPSKEEYVRITEELAEVFPIKEYGTGYYNWKHGQHISQKDVQDKLKELGQPIDPQTQKAVQDRLREFGLSIDTETQKDVQENAEKGVQEKAKKGGQDKSQGHGPK